MKYIFIIVAALLVSACKKDENLQAPPPFGFRAPSCDDLTDDGSWEHYNDSEAVLLLGQYYFDHPDTLDTTAVSGISISSHDVEVNKGSAATFNYTPHRRLSLVLAIAYDRELFMKAYFKNTDSNGLKSVSLSTFQTTNLAQQVKVQPGCYRLYYFFAEEYTDNRVPAFRPVNKGHFDINVIL